MLPGSRHLQWVASLKYLGINLLSGSTLIIIDSCLTKPTFYKACNGIFSYCSRAYVFAFVKLSLFKAYIFFKLILFTITYYCFLIVSVVLWISLLLRLRTWCVGTTAFNNYLVINCMNQLKKCSLEENCRLILSSNRNLISQRCT